MRLRRPRNRCALAAALSACASLFVGCATFDMVVAEPGVSFSLPLGRSATLNGTDARITFRQVREDSRCPIDVQCIQAGDAKIELTIARSRRATDRRIISLTPPANVVAVDDLRIHFDGLTPPPRQNETEASRAYVAHLSLNKD
jgi:hypothetical protein